MLPGQILSFVANHGAEHSLTVPVLGGLVHSRPRAERSLLFVVITDIWDKDAYTKAIAVTGNGLSTVSRATNVWVEYWPLDRQAHFFRKLLRGTPGGEGMASLLRDHGERELRGVRGVQNRSVLIADYLTRRASGSIVYHKLDDDMLPFVASEDQQRATHFDHAYDVLGHKAARLSTPSVRVLGSKYSIDSPSPLQDLVDGLAGAGSFLESFEESGARLTRSIEDRSGMIVGPWAPAITEEWRQSPPWSEFGQLVSLLQGGINRFSFDLINSFDAHFCEARDTLPGGFVSFRKETNVIPVPPVGHQDVLFSVLQHALHGGVHGDLPVGHSKSLIGRRPILEALTAHSRILGGRTDPQVTTNFLSIAGDAGIKIGDGLPEANSYAGWRHHRLIDALAPATRMTIESSERFLASSRALGDAGQRMVLQLRAFCEQVRSNLDAVQSGYTYCLNDPQPASDELRLVFENWWRNTERFQSLRDHAGRLGAFGVRTPQA